VRIVHLTTVDLSLRYLILPQLEAAARLGESFGISAPGPYVSEIEKRGIRHVPLHSSTRGVNVIGDLKAMRQFWRALRTIRPDIVHTHNPKPGVYGRVLSRLAGVPIVVNTVHGLYATADSPVLKRLVVYGLEAIASRFSDAELIQNPEDLDLLRRRRIVPVPKLRLLGNGVDLQRFNPDRVEDRRSAARRELGLEAGDVAVGMVGRLVAEKGIPELIEAARMLGPGIRVLVAGPNDPAKDDAISPRLLEDGRVAGVSFVGMREDIDVFYSALDVFVLPSHREGFPRAAMEAAASGLPLVLTDIRGCRQVVEDGVNGLLVAVRAPEQLAAAIAALAEDTELRQRMGKASAERARSQFDENRVVEIVMSTYADIAREKGLSWKLASSAGGDAMIRQAGATDARAIARLHAEMIDTGFLSTLGPSFLELLYRALITSARGTVIVVEDDGSVVGFVAGVDDTGLFYREFLRANLIRAGIRVVPALLRPGTWRRVWETLRYGTSREDGVGAELLSMAVAPVMKRRGLGTRLVGALQNSATSKGLRAMKVVVGSSNHPAIGLYESCGFGDRHAIEVHSGENSLELVWRSPGS
jgi:glycosyltransferase involved in cell wall biosynthesis/ribosomal protein S18 acetylase RimI-like enzyme